MDNWTIQDSIDTYNIKNWGKDYFSVNDKGHVTVHPDKRSDHAIDLKELVDQLQARGIALPILIRFIDNVPSDEREWVQFCVVPDEPAPTELTAGNRDKSLDFLRR